MKKNGFTLIEILVSITLVSIVLVSMLNTLVKLKDVYATSNDDTDVRVYGSTISRIINNDLIKNDGIKVLNPCTTNGIDSLYESKCIFTLNSGDERVLDLRVSSETSAVQTNAQTKENYIVKITRSTIDYTDSITNRIILVKTIYSKEIYSVKEGEITGTTERKYYHFTGIKSTHKDYANVITIEASDPEFNLVIYSSGT